MTMLISQVSHFVDGFFFYISFIWKSVLFCGRNIFFDNFTLLVFIVCQVALLSLDFVFERKFHNFTLELKQLLSLG